MFKGEVGDLSGHVTLGWLLQSPWVWQQQGELKPRD
jgi:hypothetical protein